MEERGGERELKEALSLFRFRLSPFPPGTPDTQATPRGTFFILRNVPDTRR